VVNYQTILSALSAIPDGLIIIDEQNLVQFFNPAARALIADAITLEVGCSAPEMLLDGADELTIGKGAAARQIALRVIAEDQSRAARVIWLHDITEHKRLQESEREQRAFVEALREIGSSLNTLTSLDEVLNGIFDQMARVMPYDAATISVIEGDETWIISERGYKERGFDVIGLRFPTDSTANIKQVISTKRPFIIPDVREEPTWIKTPNTEWLRSQITVPMKIGDAVFGFLHLDIAAPNFFNHLHFERMSVFADQIAIAVRNAKLLDDYARRVAELEEIIEARTASLREALAKEQAINALKSRFISLISHEFKNPLASILLSTDMIKRYTTRMTPERLQEYVESIQAQVSSLTLLIDDMLFAHRAEQVGFPFKPKQVDLRGFCDQIIRDIMPLAGDHHQIRLVMPDNCGVLIIDEGLMHRTLINLLTNAIKYSPGGGSVILEANCEESGLTLSVSDNGIGIPEDDLEHIFDTFYRASNAEGYPGTGIGLTIAKQAVELHGGTIEVRSQRGVGTTFTIRIPPFPTQYGEESIR
jgi:signal transduction histidine kinase